MKTLEESIRQIMGIWDIWGDTGNHKACVADIAKLLKKEIRRREKEWTNSKSGIDGSIYGKGTGRDGSVY